MKDGPSCSKRASVALRLMRMIVLEGEGVLIVLVDLCVKYEDGDGKSQTASDGRTLVTR